MSVNRGALTSTHKVTGGCYVALLLTNITVNCGFSISETHNLFLICNYVFACFSWCLVKAISTNADNSLSNICFV